MSDIPWWSLPLTAAAFALLGAVAAQLVTIRNEHGGAQARKNQQWYEERRAAYVGLLAAFERTTVRLRVGFGAGVTEPDPLLYADEVGPALMRVRLLASAPVRSAALAVHLVLEDMHGLRPPPVPGREVEKHFLERLRHVPLVMHEFEVAVRDELDIDPNPPPAAPTVPGLRQRVAALVTGARRPQPAEQRSEVVNSAG